MGNFFCHVELEARRRWQKNCIPLNELTLDFNPKPLKTLGIDVEVKYHDIKRIYFKRYLKQILALGQDPEDMLQEIMQGILVRNKGKCPYDPDKSAFSTYVTMVCHCVMTNFFKKHSRTAGMEVALEPIERKIQDMESFDQEEEYQRLKGDVASLFQGEYRKVFDLLTDGYKTKEISKIMGLDTRIVRQKLGKIREIVSCKTELRGI